MLRKTSLVAIFGFALLGTANFILGKVNNSPDQFEYGLVWLGIATIAALVFWLSRRK
jgi:hypothetical protein